MRTNRIKVLGGVYHCMSRVVAGEYLLGKREKEVFCKQLFQVADFCGVEVLTYCIMSNHFHVLVRVPERVELSDGELLERAQRLYWNEDKYLGFIKNVFNNGDVDQVQRLRERLYSRMFDVSSFMKEVKQRFSIWYNKNHGRYGVFWADRFKSVLVEGKRHAVEMVAAYIDLNPVRAGLVKDPKDYRYSGYGEAMGGVNRSRRGIMKAVYEKNDWKKALEAYRELLFGKGAVAQKIGQRTVDDNVSKAVLDKQGKLSTPELLRCRVKYFTEGAIIGSKVFIQNCYEQNLEKSNSKRFFSPKEMHGGDWGILKVFRMPRS